VTVTFPVTFAGGDRAEILGVDVPLHHRAAERVTEFVQGSTRVAQVSGEVFVGFAGEALGYVSTDRIHRIVDLPLRLDVACESWSRREIEDFLSDLIADSPDEQLRIVIHSFHDSGMCMRCSLLKSSQLWNAPMETLHILQSRSRRDDSETEYLRRVDADRPAPARGEAEPAPART